MALSARTEKLLAGGEGLDVDYKASVGQEFNDLLVAFANGEGGICLFGVTDAAAPDGRHIGRVIGVEVSDRMRGRIQSRADQTHDQIEIEIEDEQSDAGLGIYIVTVKEGPNKPYCTGGGRYLVRREGQNAPITPSMMERFIAHRLRGGTPAHQIFLMDELRELREELTNAMRSARKNEPPFYSTSSHGLMRRDAKVDDLVANCTDAELARTLSQFVELATQFADTWFAIGRRLPKDELASPHSLAPQSAIEKELLAIGGNELKQRMEAAYRIARQRMDALLGRT